MRILMVLLLLGFFLGDVASAQSVYKCVAKGKTTSFQSAPCAAGTTTARTMLAIPEPVATQPQPGYVYAQQQPVSPADSVRPAGVDPSRAQRRAYCESARRNRQATLDAVGMNRTYELLQQLDRAVSEACSGL